LQRYTYKEDALEVSLFTLPILSLFDEVGRFRTDVLADNETGIHALRKRR
jgi:hypothetical protein